MKPSVKYFAVRAVFLTLCAVSLISTLGSAETLRGNFTIKTETHWGKLLLSPGAYQFKVESDASGKMITVSSTESQWSGIAMAQSTSDAQPDQGMKLVSERSGGDVYVRQLCLGDSTLTMQLQNRASSRDWPDTNRRQLSLRSRTLNRQGRPHEGTARSPVLRVFFLATVPFESRLAPISMWSEFNPGAVYS
jgi:hypothetical protein